MNDPDKYEIASVSLGRHTDMVEDSICSRAVKKIVSISASDDGTDLFVETECPECGTVSKGLHESVDILEEDEDDE